MAKVAGRGGPRVAWRGILFGLGIFAFLLVAGAGTLFAGYLVGAWQVFPADIFGRVERRLATHLPGGASQEMLRSTVVPSALVRLKTDVGRVDFERSPGAGPMAENGGGLTAFGDGVLLLPYDGRLYAATGSEDIRATGLAAPDNGRAAYLAHSEDPAFAEFRFARGFLRYNDIAYFRAPSGHGLLASYTEYHPEDACATNTIARLDLPADRDGLPALEAASSDDWTVIFRTEPCLALKDYHLALEGHMAGGKLAFAAPSTIYLASSDFHLDGMRSRGAPIAQDPQAMYGKVVAVELDGSNRRIVSMGHRNMQGIALTQAGEIVVAEHGPRGGDEVNIVRDGANYGWPLETYGTTYVSTAIPNALSFSRHDTFEPPIHAWVPSVATSAIVELQDFDPAWDGDLLVGSLLDQSLHRLRRQGDTVVYSERIPIGTRIRDVELLPDGRLVLWSDNQELIFMTGEGLLDIGARLNGWISSRDISEPVATQLRQAVVSCAECHSFQVDDHERSPSLAKIHGERIASTAYSGYSAALRSKQGSWTDENLQAFLADPQAFAPGTAMPDPGLADPVTAVLAQYLEQLRRDF